MVGDSENHMSIDFHKKMGFEEVGVIKSIGYKFERWLDSVMLQLTLGEGDTNPPPKDLFNRYPKITIRSMNYV